MEPTKDPDIDKELSVIKSENVECLYKHINKRLSNKKMVLTFY